MSKIVLKTEKQGIVYFSRILDPIRRIYWLHFIVDRQIIIGNPKFSLETLDFLLETSWFLWFLLETPSFSSETPDFSEETPDF